jgi:hypothetical protein
LDFKPARALFRVAHGSGKSVSSQDTLRSQPILKPSWPNLPVSLVNHATGPHAFDLFDDSVTSREIIRRILAFLQFHLLATPAAGKPATLAL